MNGDLKYVGKSIPLIDAEAKVTGKIKYITDMELPGMLYGKLLLSNIPHGIVKNIDTSEAEKIPGVVGIYTYKNTPDIKYSGFGWYRGQNVLKNERMFTDRVRYVGDRVAIVVAENQRAAEIAVKLIKVEYQELPAVFDPEEAIESDIILHDDIPKVIEKETKCGDPESILDKAEIVIEDKVVTQRIHHAAMEPHACLADYDEFGKVTVWSPCQIAFGVKTLVAAVTNLPYNKVRIIKVPMGGTFGGKQEAILEPICAYLSLVTKRPVKIVMSRRESIISTRTRTGTVSYVRTAVDKTGQLLARDIKTIVNTGAYTTNGVALNIALGKKLFRLYRIKDQRYKGITVHTNVPIAGACRGYGSPQCHLISELNMEHAARAIGIDPVELRLKNLVHPYDVDPTNNQSLGNARIIDCVIKGAEEFKWNERAKAPKGNGRYKTGIGMACSTHGNGYGHFGPYPDYTTMRLRMYEDGSMLLHSGSHELGCGTVTTMIQIIAEVMDVDPSAIAAPEVDTDVSPYDTGSQASRVMHICGECAVKVAEKLREQLIEQAASYFNCSICDIELENGLIWNRKDGQKKTYGDIATFASVKNQVELCATYHFQAQDNIGSYAADFAKVTVDTMTGLVKVDDFVAVHDVGKAINPKFVEGQILGGVQMGIGMAISEDVGINKSGNIINDKFSKYHIINAPDMPDVRVFLIEKGEDHGPFGAKSVGEIATVPVAAAIVNAINDALGTNITVLPVTPERIINELAKLKTV